MERAVATKAVPVTASPSREATVTSDAAPCRPPGSSVATTATERQPCAWPKRIMGAAVLLVDDVSGKVHG